MSSGSASTCRSVALRRPWSGQLCAPLIARLDDLAGLDPPLRRDRGVCAVVDQRLDRLLQRLRELRSPWPPASRTAPRRRSSPASCILPPLCLIAYGGHRRVGATSRRPCRARRALFTSSWLSNLSLLIGRLPAAVHALLLRRHLVGVLDGRGLHGDLQAARVVRVDGLAGRRRPLDAGAEVGRRSRRSSRAPCCR